MAATQSELRLARLIDEREHTQTLHEGKLADVGDDHHEDRRQQQPLQEAEDDERLHVRRKRHQDSRPDSGIIAAVITRLRPSTSASAPVNGAVSAIASVDAVMVALTSAASAPNSWRQPR